MGRQLRSEHDLKVRQPLSALHVVSRNAELIEQVAALQDIALDELNVKEFRSSGDEVALATLKAKPDFSRLGPRFGKQMRLVASCIAQLDQAALSLLADGGTVPLTVGEEEITLEADDVVLERIPREGLVVVSEGDMLVALETELTPELLCEGLARELVNKVQNMRKSADLDVSQRITMSITGDDAIAAAVDAYREYVSTEVLCVALEWSEEQLDDSMEWVLNEHPCWIRIEAV